MTDTDKSELEIIVESTRREAESGKTYYMSKAEAIKRLAVLIQQQCNQARIDGEKVGAFMTASAILTEMSPLMVHRLENGFPGMTGEVIGNVYEVVKKEMKPYQDIRKAQAKETEGINE